MKEIAEITNEILTLIRSGLTDEELKKTLEHYHESDIADAVPYLTKEERKRLYDILGDEVTSDIFTYLDDVEDFLAELSNDEAADIIEEMDADDAVDVLEELDEEDKNKIVEQMEEEAIEDIKMIESYDEDEIGSKMTTNYISIPRGSSIKLAMKIVVSEANENDNLSNIYVVNEDNTFYGLIDLKDLVIARSNVDLETITRTNYPTLHAHDKVSDVINDLKEYALNMIPVLDEHDHLIGVITSSDIVEVVDEEMSDDYAKLGGLSEEEDLNESLGKSLRKRLPWLLLLLVLGLVVSLVISQFEGIIAAIPMAVFFQSIVLDMTGNVGTQSLAVTIRFLNDEDNDRKKKFKMLGKEVRVGFINGLVLGFTSGLVVFLFLLIRNKPITGDTFAILDAVYLGCAVMTALVFSLVLASFLGVAIPTLLKKLKVDPAVASGPLITTLDDVVAAVVYYGLTMLFFSFIL